MQGRKKFLYAIMMMAIIGLITSIYLVQGHYEDVSSGSLCDFTDTISCSIANTSSFSEFLNVPVALFGAFWMVLLFIMAGAMIRNKLHAGAMLVWTGLGILSVVYFVAAEFILGVLCPFCTVVHAIIVVAFILSWRLANQEHHWSRKAVWKSLRPYAVWMGGFFLLCVILFTVYAEPEGDYTEFAQCVTDAGVSMYSSGSCSVCVKNKELFGDAVEYIEEIECHPDGDNSQWELCVEKEVSGTPTWIMEVDGEEVKRFAGYLTLEELAEFSGCTLEA